MLVVGRHSVTTIPEEYYLTFHLQNVTQDPRSLFLLAWKLHSHKAKTLLRKPESSRLPLTQSTSACGIILSLFNYLSLSSKKEKAKKSLRNIGEWKPTHQQPFLFFCSIAIQLCALQISDVSMLPGIKIIRQGLPSVMELLLPQGERSEGTSTIPPLAWKPYPFAVDMPSQWHHHPNSGCWQEEP